MLKNEKSANRNDHQNRKTEVFCNKNRKTDLKHSQNCKTENPNAPLFNRRETSCQACPVHFVKRMHLSLAVSLRVLKQFNVSINACILYLTARGTYTNRYVLFANSIWLIWKHTIVDPRVKTRSEGHS